jgi:hypothetical protein
MFLVLFAVSIIPDYIHIFGDWTCSGSGVKTPDGVWSLCSRTKLYHSPDVHWGSRHILFLLTGIAIFCVQFCDFVIYLLDDE